jgi:hypothetical protein
LVEVVAVAEQERDRKPRDEMVVPAEEECMGIVVEPVIQDKAAMGAMDSFPQVFLTPLEEEEDLVLLAMLLQVPNRAMGVLAVLHP